MVTLSRLQWRCAFDVTTACRCSASLRGMRQPPVGKPLARCLHGTRSQPTPYMFGKHTVHAGCAWRTKTANARRNLPVIGKNERAACCGAKGNMLQAEPPATDGTQCAPRKRSAAFPCLLAADRPPASPRCLPAVRALRRPAASEMKAKRLLLRTCLSFPLYVFYSASFELFSVSFLLSPRHVSPLRSSQQQGNILGNSPQHKTM